VRKQKTASRNWLNLTLPTTSQHHSNIRTHAHITPIHASPTRTCTLTMRQGFS